MKEARPLRTVANAKLMTGRGSTLGPDTSRRTSWWDLTLDCGHHVERPVNQGSHEHVRKLECNGQLKRPGHARCDLCPKENR